MITVSTKQELENAISNNVPTIKVVGSFAETLVKKTNRRKKGKGAAIAIGILGIGCLIAAPFTGGLTLLGEGLVAGATIGSITLSTTELAIICGTALCAVALAKGYNAKVIYRKEGPVVIFHK